MAGPPNHPHARSAHAATGTGGHVAAGHVTRSAPGLATAGLAMPQISSPFHDVRAVLLTLAWPHPDTMAAAQRAVEELERTHRQLQDPGSLAAIPDAEVREASERLCAAACWVLGYWTSELDKTGTGGWTREQAAALGEDLTRIARTGAGILNRIERLEPGGAPSQVEASYLALVPAPRHARGRRDRPGTAVDARAGGSEPSWVGAYVAVAQIPREVHRALVFGGAVAIGAAAIGAGWYVKYDRYHRGSAAPRAVGSFTNPAQAATAGASAAEATGPKTSADRAPTVSAEVTSLHMQLLGASAAQPRVEVYLALATTGVGAVTVRLSWVAANRHSGQVTQVLAGDTAYDYFYPIDAASLCGGAVTVTAAAGGRSTSSPTSAGPCSAPITVRPSTSEEGQ